MTTKHCIINTLLVACALFACSSCDQKEKTQSETVLKVSATLSSYATPDGTAVGEWKSTDRLYLYNARNGAKASARPAATGDKLSMFSLKMAGVQDKDRLIGYYPLDNVKISGEIVNLDIPQAQNGQFVAQPLIGSAIHSASRATGDEMILRPTAAYIVVGIAKGDTRVTKVELKSNAGEAIAGDVTLDTRDGSFSAKSDNVTVSYPSGLDCKAEITYITMMVAPASLSKGYTIKFTCSKGFVEDIVENEATEFKAGACTVLGASSNDSIRKLLACGSDKVYLFNAEKVSWGGSYKDGLMWTWNCTSVQGTCSGAKSSSHIDDVVVCANKKQLLVTCSNNGGWCVLIEPDYNVSGSARLLFWTNSAPNAHSAEMLPDGYVVVACSVDGGDCLQLYDINQNNKVLATYPLVSAHGAVWNEASKRLYAIGNQTLQIYKWDSANHVLVLDKEVSTNGYVSGLHDLSLVDDNTLIMGSSHAALYNIKTGAFTSLKWFNNTETNGIKSINYNAITEECYYTYAVEATSEGAYSWSSHKIRYTGNLNATYSLTAEKHIIVDDINMYKVRVLNW